MPAVDSISWTPNPGPQTDALNCQADELFYGGAAGGGKSDLLLGAAGTQHRSAIIFRRVFPSLRGIIERSREIYNSHGATHLKDSYNESLHIWRLRDGRTVEFGSVQYEKDKENYRGRPHDLYAWDELPEFTETQFRFVNAWNRSTFPNQRCRVIATGNPPATAEGLWVIEYWAPWLYDQHPNPAKPGELRWFARIDDRDEEVENGEPFDWKGEIIYPRSRTFIPALLKDNPALEATGYGAIIQGLPEPLRSQMLYGDFTIGVSDDSYQVIPTQWVRDAMKRGREMERPDGPQSALGVDVAYGGRNKTVIAPRYGFWVDPLLKYPGKETPSGKATAVKVINARRGDAPVNIDLIGYGSAGYEHLQDAIGVHMARGINFGAPTQGSDVTGRLKFANVRAEAHWKLREILDPDNNTGVCLPDDPELLADLTAPRWQLRAGKIYIESKDEIKDRIGRSPDCGDAVVLSFYGAEPLPAGTTGRINPKTPSRFVKRMPTGSRWGRSKPTGYRRR